MQWPPFCGKLPYRSRRLKTMRQDYNILLKREHGESMERVFYVAIGTCVKLGCHFFTESSLAVIGTCGKLFSLCQSLQSSVHCVTLGCHCDLSQAWMSLELVASLTFLRLVSCLAVNIMSVKLDC